MISMPAAYKQAMDTKYRNQSYMLVTIGIINQVAQKDVKATAEHGVAYSYLSNFTRPFNNYDVELEYATWEQNWFKADGSMVFPPKPEEADYLYNNGIISKKIKGGICIAFGRAYDIRGLTISWGRNYPVDFTVTNGEKTVSFQENDKAYWTTEEIFDNTEYLLIIPEKMVNGENRLRIQKILMGVGVSFENKKIQIPTLALILQKLEQQHGRFTDRKESERETLLILEHVSELEKIFKSRGVEALDSGIALEQQDGLNFLWLLEQIAPEIVSDRKKKLISDNWSFAKIISYCCSSGAAEIGMTVKQTRHIDLKCLETFISLEDADHKAQNLVKNRLFQLLSEEDQRNIVTFLLKKKQKKEYADAEYGISEDRIQEELDSLRSGKKRG